ncbi:MAG TPA: hypothetical protein VLM40_12480, partial [Gemmata sp.]|nr:hypothetical protein [Gemmata sp.]
MSEIQNGRRDRFALGFRVGLAALTISTTVAGCAREAEDAPAAQARDTGESSGLSLPPDFVPVNLPPEKRKEIFKEACIVRALAVQKANRELPMDNAHLPRLDLEANTEQVAAHKAKFDKRVAEHKAIVDRHLAKDLAALADRSKITA